MNQGPLNDVSVARVPEEQGVYQLFLDGTLVYVGKTDAEAGLNKRLARHARKIHHRHGLDPGRVSFKAVRVYVFTAMDLEQQLIKHYQHKNIALDWNMSGFGANDPGRERDTTKLKAGHFDLNYPINIDIPIVIPQAGIKAPVSDILAGLKTSLPYTLRYENAGGRVRKPHPDLVANTITIPKSSDTVRNVLLQIKPVLGSAWQITLQPGYITIYCEHKAYPHGKVL